MIIDYWWYLLIFIYYRLLITTIIITLMPLLFIIMRIYLFMIIHDAAPRWSMRHILLPSCATHLRTYLWALRRCRRHYFRLRAAAAAPPRQRATLFDAICRRRYRFHAASLAVTLPHYYYYYAARRYFGAPDAPNHDADWFSLRIIHDDFSLLLLMPSRYLRHCHCRFHLLLYAAADGCAWRRHDGWWHYDDAACCRLPPSRHAMVDIARPAATNIDGSIEMMLSSITTPSRFVFHDAVLADRWRWCHTAAPRLRRLSSRFSLFRIFFHLFAATTLMIWLMFSLILSFLLLPPTTPTMTPPAILFEYF